MNYNALSDAQFLIFLGCARQYLNNDKGVNLMKKKTPDGTEFKFKCLIRQ